MSSSPIAILGAGKIGRNLAQLLVDAGYSVVLANSRGPETLHDTIAALGPLATAVSATEAVAAAELVIEAVPFKVVPNLPSLDQRILVTAANYYPDRDGTIDLAGRSQARWVADHHPGAQVVKAFNTIWFQHLASQGDATRPVEARRALPVASDDESALQQVCALIEALGFAPLRVGGLDDHADLIQPGGALYNRDLTLAEARERFAEFSRAR
ncbi:MAG: NAD(P)-binding domain-containing protein [Myxococcota bacterium]